MKNSNQRIKNQYVIIQNKNQNKNFYNMISPKKIKKNKSNKFGENLIIKDFITSNNIKERNIKKINKRENNLYTNQNKDFNKYYSTENLSNEYRKYIDNEYNQNYENESGSERLHQIKDEYIEYLQKQLDDNNKNMIKYETKINEFSRRYKNLIEDNKLLNETLNERTSKLNEVIQENENLRVQLNNNIENENQIKLFYEKKLKENENSINEYNNMIKNLKEKKDINKNNIINNENINPNIIYNNNDNNEEELQLIKNQNLIYLNNLKSKDNTIELITKENEKLLLENKEYRTKIEEYTQKITNLYSTIKQKNQIINALKKNEGIIEDENSSEKKIMKNEGLKICYSQENLTLNFLSNNNNKNINKEKENLLDNSKDEICNNTFNIEKNKKNNDEKINQSIDKLIFDNEENKMKIEMLNNKLKSFDNFEKKYFEFIQNKNNDSSNNEGTNQINTKNKEKNFRYLNIINEKNDFNENNKENNINDDKLNKNDDEKIIKEEKQNELFNDITNNDETDNLDLKSYKKYKAKENGINDVKKGKEIEKNEEKEKENNEETKKTEDKEKEKEKEKAQDKEVKKEGPRYRYGFMYRRRLMREKAEKEKEEKEKKDKEEEEKKKEEQKEKEEKKEIKKHGMEENPKDEKYEVKQTVREMNRKRNLTHIPKIKKRFKISEQLDVTEINTSSPVVPQSLSFAVDNKNIINLENVYLFGIDRNDYFHIFDIKKRRWSKKKILEIEDISDTFQKDYQYEGTILYNTLNGLFILTGKKLDILYYYNAQNETINKICKFNNSHDNGSLMLEKENNRLFVFGGKNTVSCEYYSFKDKKVCKIPDLNKERANASFICCNNKIFAFFGFSYEKNNYSESIEFIDIKKLDKWHEINDIKKLNKEITFDIESISTLLMKNENNKILIYAGIKGENEDYITNNYYIFDCKENSIDLINKWDTKMMRFTGTRWKNYTLSKRDPAGFHFAKNSNFLEIPKELEIEGYENEGDINLLIDYKNNVHFINQEKKIIDIFKGDI